MPRKRILFAALLAALVVSIASMAPRGAAVVIVPSGTYDAVGDFSITSNPNGSWSYGWEANLGGSFTHYAVENSAIYQGADFWEGPDNCGGEFLMPLVGFNHTGSTLNYASGVSQPANMLNLHPSCAGRFSVVRWTAPTTGSFNVQGLFQGIDTRSTRTDVHIRQNSSTALLDANINGYGNERPFGFTRNMTAGETLDFIVGFGSNGNYNYDSTGLAVTITPPNTYNIPDGDVAGLIAAIHSANASGEASTINLAHNGHYVLTTAADSADISAGLPFITATSHVTINGNGATIQRSNADGTPDFWLLQVSAGTVTIDGLTLTGGSQGGLRMSSSTVIVQNSTITQNTGGGGINNICGSLTLLNSTVSNNTSDSAWGGGGVFMWGSSCAPGMPTANISFSTIFENSNPGWGRGNAIGTAYVASPGGVFLKNSILASPSHPSEAVCNNGQGTLYSLGHNILGDATDVFGSRCYEALTAPGDMVNTNPLLGPLANNGGPTPTNQPLPCSPAIDAVPVAYSTETNGVSVTTDQRGISRPQGAASDIGAVEAVRTVTVTVPGNAGPWLQGQNPTSDYGVHDNVSPVVINASSGIPFIVGSNITVSYVSGTFTGDGGHEYVDANGSTYPTNTYEGGNGRFPGFYMNPGPTVYGGELVGAFAHDGLIVGTPFPIGNGPTTLVIPSGATELMMGINDNYYSDNSGALIIRVTTAPTLTMPTISCPLPTTVSAYSHCQARVPNVIAGVTASGGCGGPVTLSQSPAAGTLVGLGTATITLTATDASNNSTSCTTSFTVTDNTPPTITITAPSNGAIYLVNHAVAASYSCADCGGVQSCAGPVASGGNIDTHSVGLKTFTVSARDNDGNNATPQSVNYSVTYGVRVLLDQSRAAKSGSTVPIKIQLVDANGNNVSSSAIGVHALSVVQISSSASVVLDDAGQANPDFDFRYDSSLGGYIFNLKTTGYGTGSYVLKFSIAGDPMLHSVQFQVRQ